MHLQRWQVLIARLCFLAYALFTSIYCLLAYVPFAYQQIHVGQLLPALTALVHWHALLFWPAIAAALLTIIPALQRGPARLLARTFAISALAAGVLLMLHPLLPHLRNDVTSLEWSISALIPLMWIAAIDLVDGFGRLEWSGDTTASDSKLFFATSATAFFASSIYFLIALMRLMFAHKNPGDASQLVSTFLLTVLSHGLLFFLIFVIFDFVALFGFVAAGENGPRTKVKFLGAAFTVGVLICLAVHYVILPPLSLGTANSFLIAFALGSTLVLFVAGTNVSLWDVRLGPVEQGGDLLVAPFRFLRKEGGVIQTLYVAAAAGLACFLSLRISQMDWEFVIQKMAVLIVWGMAFAIFYSIAPKSRWLSRTTAYTTGLALLLCYLGLQAARPAGVDANSQAQGAAAPEPFQNYDVSLRLADAILRSQLGSQSSTNAPFYSFLAQNTNIPRSTRLTPVDIHLVSQLRETSTERPNIFVIVIDSLRRDYLSPYNSSLNFTPEVDGFARDSVIFENAFTRYGGTGLSEPSIWVGGLIPHQQYTEPFAPMNSLQKLLEANHYREWISKDNVLQQVVPASPNIDELDRNIGAMSYDLCRTLDEVTERLPSVGNDPVFVYTQAQNIHVSVIDREGRSVPKGVTFPDGFDAAYASRLQHMDRCLGNFFQSLKKNKLYDHSLIVLTSDHGDSLGEGGRWGHAYTIFPEIVRIPLIVHLPTQWHDRLQYAPQSLAFLTDLTPSFYYLLNEKPLVNDPILGRPLFTDSIEEQKPYLRDAYVVISSYAPVYGLLTQHGQRLYIADGVNYKDYAYAIEPGGASREISLSDEERASSQSQIRAQVNAIARFYGIQQ